MGPRWPFWPVYTVRMAADDRRMTSDRMRKDRVECRSCPVICERVVYPVHCLRSGCPCVYAFEEEGCLYFGCVEKVFVAELDLSPFRASPQRDVYGALKTFREPQRRCRSRVDKAYDFLYARHRCSNPTFAHHSHEFSPEAVRLLVHGHPKGQKRRGGIPDRPPEPSDS